MNKQHDMNRRQFLRQLGLGSASAFSLMAMSSFQAYGAEQPRLPANEGDIKMTYRKQRTSRSWASA